MLALASCVNHWPHDPTGALEVCKAPDNGMAGTPFQFSIDGGPSFTVVGGGCSGIRQVSAPGGTHTITELPAANTTLVGVNVVNGAPSSQNGNTETVTVSNDGTAANETRVTFVNAGPGPGVLKVCKQSADPTLQGSGFSFTENNGPAFTVVAGPVGSPNCDSGTTYQNGTRVNVHELIPTNVHVSAIDVSNGRGSNVDLANGNVTATVGLGTTIVTYTDQVNPIPQTGFIEVCKAAGDRFVTGTFDFTVIAPGQTIPVRGIFVGQCSGPIQVNAGNVRVLETAQNPFTVSGFATFPGGRLVSENDINGEATVVVPVSASSTNETRVTVTNVTTQALVKVCKTLASNGAALAGRFLFNVTDVAGGEQVGVNVNSVGAPGQCSFLSTGLPVGSTVTATEVIPDNAPFVVDNGSQTITVQSGINSINFTNTATGFIEVCKTPLDPSTANANNTFGFSVTGAVNPAQGSFTLHPNQCQTPIQVFAGQQTVTETTIPSNFVFDHATAVHALDNSNAVVSGSGSSIVVDVHTSGTMADETKATFFNKVKTGTFKVCKITNPVEPTLANTPFPFTTSYTVNGVTVPNSFSLIANGPCSGTSADIPVVDSSGNPITVTVTETQNPALYKVLGVQLAGAGSNLSANTTTGVSTFNIGVGASKITYNNGRSG